MSYSNASPGARDRAKGIAGVVAIHALIGAGVVTGLSITGVIEEEDKGIAAIFTPRPQDPPPPPPPTDAADPMVDPPVSPPPSAPRPPIDLVVKNPIDVVPATPSLPQPTVRIPMPNPGPTVRVAPPAPAVTPMPTATFTPTSPSPSNGPAGWITNSDYSASDIRRGNEGTARYRLVIGSDGRVDACEIVSGTGHASLDRDTCRLIERRARFDAARDASGERVVGTYTGSVTWRIPE
ncbi:TonB family protein [Aurantiacibacter spongiae]|uniref:TonB family protein n=1 Tax=Aurantiacibacter spongiae TaxID=2488860 RepID=A0A3N5CUE8_9SPHN|nr:TonB family protein [Aurantiacibacter spongiae]RPF72347.1 TonB family protein [Aurantiacibacter spongiae]